METDGQSGWARRKKKERYRYFNAKMDGFMSEEKLQKLKTTDMVKSFTKC